MWAHVWWWHYLHDIQPLRCRGYIHLFLEICKGIWKTEVVYQTPQGSYDTGQNIQIEDLVLTQVNKFKYLGCTVINNSKLDVELDTQMSNASKAFSEMRKWVWLNKDLSITIKCVVYLTFVLSTFLYGAETWTVYKADTPNLHTYMMCHEKSKCQIVAADPK